MLSLGMATFPTPPSFALLSVALCVGLMPHGLFPVPLWHLHWCRTCSAHVWAVIFISYFYIVYVSVCLCMHMCIAQPTRDGQRTHGAHSSSPAYRLTDSTQIIGIIIRVIIIRVFTLLFHESSSWPEIVGI